MRSLRRRILISVASVPTSVRKQPDMTFSGLETMSAVSLTDESSDEDEVDFSWTTGQSPDIAHECLIARGGFGEVHKVPYLL
jgi:hypothetical protein